MRTLENRICHEIEIKNSRFLCYLIPMVDSDIRPFLGEIQREHPKATHYCYAYIYDSIKHFFDDGEPGGTAGMPILNVLEKEELNHVLAVVVRYFGGIKLGAGGLVRAYTKSVTETLKESSFVFLVPGFKISLTFPYDEEKNILYILGKNIILDRQYLSDITYTCLIDRDTFQKLEKYHPTVLEECFIKKLNES